MWWKLHVKPQNLKVLAKNEGITQKNLEILIKPPQWKKTRRLQNLAKLMLKDLGKCWTNLRKVTQPQLQIHLGLTFRSNNGKEYFNQELTSYLEHEGILHHSSCVSNPTTQPPPPPPPPPLPTPPARWRTGWLREKIGIYWK